MSNSDLNILTIPVTRVGAELTYTSVTPKEYSGPSVSSSNGMPMAFDRNGVPTTIQVKTYVAANTTTTVTPAKDAPKPTTPVIPNDVLNKIHSEGLTTLTPMIPTLPPPSTDHSHSASDVYETHDRIWFTPDERVDLRTMYAELLKLEGDISKLVPKPSRAIVFTIPDVPEVGSPIEIRFPWEGKTKELEFNYSIFDSVGASMGPASTKLNIERKPFAGGTWTPLLSTYVELTSALNKTIVPVVVDVAKDDMFRIVFSDISLGIKNIVGQVVIE